MTAAGHSWVPGRLHLMPHDLLLSRLTSILAEVPGVQAIVLGGSRARGSSHPTSDYDIGLYCSSGVALDTDRLLTVVKEIADDPGATTVTRFGEWGSWIVGGAWLSVERQKVDLLYRPADDVERVMTDCRNGTVLMAYQPGHPHGFCSAIWMGEIAYCQPLHDPNGLIARLKSIALRYPEDLRHALGKSCSASRMPNSRQLATSGPRLRGVSTGRSRASPRCCSH